MRPVTPLTNSLKLIVQPYDLDTGHCLVDLGFQSIPLIPQLFYLVIADRQLSEAFLSMSQALSDQSQSGSRYCITRSPLDSKMLLVEFLDAQPLNTITASVKHAWFLKVLATQRLFFKYQPIFELQHGQITGYECLARANDRGQAFNGQQLIDAALSMQLMREFDELARTTCLEAIAQALSNHGAAQGQPTFFINILPNAIIQDPLSIQQNLQQALDLGLQPHQIVFELTETEALIRRPELANTIGKLRQQGFRFAIDDLCSNVPIDHYFMEFRPDVIKLDRQLVAGCSHYPLKQVLIKSLLYSAHELGILVLAEGLEEVEDIDFCRSIGVDYGQGFGLAQPEQTLQTAPLNLLQFSTVS